MSITKIPYQDTGFYSKLIVDYLRQKNNLKPFYHRFPSLNEFESQIAEKKSNYNHSHRKLLVDVLKRQYKDVAVSEATAANIENLLDKDTFTVTTGHQLNLFTGPLYFLYKIISTINLCELLKENFPDKYFVPIYWMATEDHDFDEINFFRFKNSKLTWNSTQTGAVGRFSTEGLSEVLDVFDGLLGSSDNAQYLKQLFQNAYLNHSNLADATRFLANELFGSYGLVITDADDAQLKSTLVPHIISELENNLASASVRKTNELLSDYSIQVNPRDINLFYLKDNIRERIVSENGRFMVLNTEISFSKDEIRNEVQNHPDRFSPNVLVRPLYQEVLLPNLCYIGGGGELAYWLQLKSYFDASGITFPMLLLRNSVQVISSKQLKKMDKLSISIPEIFMPQQELLATKVKENSNLELSFASKIEFLKNQFSDLRSLASQTDRSFINAVNAQEKKQINGLIKLEKRLMKAEKRRLNDLVERITSIQNELLPNQGLEERQRNISTYYLEFGSEFITTLKMNLQPLAGDFSIIEF